MASTVKQSAYCSFVMKKHFNKELTMSKEDDEIFRPHKNVGLLKMMLN